MKHTSLFTLSLLAPVCLLGIAIVSCTEPITPAAGPADPTAVGQPPPDASPISAVLPALAIPCKDYPPEEKAGGLDAYKWTNGMNLRVRFIDSDASTKLCSRVMSYAKQWSKYANLTFTETSGNNAAEIRITFKGGGHWSRIGTSSKDGIGQDEPSMSLMITDSSKDSEVSRVTIHEFGHAIGLMHEHQLPSAVAIVWNEPVVLQYYKGPPNNWNEKQIRQNVLNHYSAQKFKGQYSNFDPKSIMCYPIPAGFANVVVGWNTELSKTDKEFISTWYSKN